MILPDTYAVALLLAILAILFTGSWANMFKLARKQRFELFYWDYALGVVIAVVVAAVTFGSLGFEFGGDVAGFAFVDDVMRASKHSWAYAVFAGGLFNLGIILLVASMSLAGMSVAFPVGFGLAVAVGLLMDFIAKPHVNGALIFSAIVLIVAAAVVDVIAYRALSLERAKEVIKTGKTRSTKVTASWKAVVLAAVGGPIMALANPLTDWSREPDLGMGPYAAAFMFAGGIFASTFVYNLFFMNLPVQGEPIELRDFFRQPASRHFLALFAGIVSSAGIVCYFVASSATTEGSLSVAPVLLLGPTTRHMVVLGAALLSSLWGLVAWKEFAGAPARARLLAAATPLLLAAALVLILVLPKVTA